MSAALAAARTALARGVLVADRAPGWRSSVSLYRFGRRAFSPRTVAALIKSGEAVRDGGVVKAAPANAAD